MIRPLSPFESIFIPAKTSVQMAMKCTNKSLVDPILKKLKDGVLGFHTRIDGTNLVTEKAKVPVHKLPNDLKDLESACVYMTSNHFHPLEQSLASVGANDDTIVLNFSHIAADGGYLLSLFNALRDDKEIKRRASIESQEETFAKEIEKTNYIPPFVTIDPKLTRIEPTDLNMLNLDPMTRHYKVCSHAKDLAIYNKETGQVKGLTDALWASIILSVSAHNDDFSKIGCSTCYNLRKLLKHDDFSNCNELSNISVSAEANKDTTVKELMRRLRADFNSKLRPDYLCGYIKGIQEKKPTGATMEGIGVELSNVGRFTVGGPFSDVWVNLSMMSHTTPRTALFLNFSVEGKDRNDIYTKMRYAPQSMSDREASLICDTVHYALENIDINKTCGEALDILKDFQKNKKSMFVYPKLI